MPHCGEEQESLLSHKLGELCQVLCVQAIVGDVQDLVGLVMDVK